jgi:hypothetical protein
MGSILLPVARDPMCVTTPGVPPVSHTTNDVADTQHSACPNVPTSRPLTFQASGPVTAGHGYTLTLTSHDDNKVGDATYALYDDVAIA